MEKIFEEKFREGDGIVNIGWQKQVEDALDVSNLMNFGYISGYKNAADDLIEKVVDTSLAESYVFPIVFLYRQYLELVLKNLYAKMPQKNKGNNRPHDLLSLWGKVEPNLLKEVTKEQLNFIRTVCKEFHRIDPKSSNFRYFWKYGNSPTLSGHISVDLKLLKKDIDQVDTILYGSYG